ncbi:MAG: hypothetical protein FJ308_02600 [Planctomycetes bacterium]|nr:hypothetical protein [Planctomycetota bacterium]
MQRWCVVGLTPMHEAMVHRMAVHYLSQHSLTMHWQSIGRWDELLVEASNILLQDTDASDSFALSKDSASRFPWRGSRNWADVIIMEVDQLCRMSDAMVLNSSQLPMPSSSDPCIRLAWGWGAIGRSETVETADYIVPIASLAHGLIHNAETLDGWIRSAVIHARNHPIPPHPLLQNLSIPSLAP